VDEVFLATKDKETRLFYIAVKTRKNLRNLLPSKNVLPINDKSRATSEIYFSPTVFSPSSSKKIECILINGETTTTSPATADGPQLDNMCLAKSYSNFSGKPVDILWKLHLRHGHKNFADVARQYNLPIPTTIPACSSCVMGKGHSHPHLGGNFDRAVRVGQGFMRILRAPFKYPLRKVNFIS